MRRLSVKQSMVIYCMQRAMESSGKSNCTVDEILNEISKKYPQAFANVNAVKTLITSKLFIPKYNACKKILAKRGLKRTCLITNEYKHTYRLTIPSGAMFATEAAMKESLPRITKKKTGRKPAGHGLPSLTSDFWTTETVDLRAVILHIGEPRRRALAALLTCIKNGTPEPTNVQVGVQLHEMFKTDPNNARKRLAELERDYRVVHAIKPEKGGNQYWKVGPRPGQEIHTKHVTKKDQENRLKNRLFKLLGRTLVRHMYSNRNMKVHAMILGADVESIRKLMPEVAGPLWRKTINREILPEEDTALEDVEEKLRRKGNLPDGYNDYGDDDVDGRKPPQN